jgi:hypothetical protein
MGLSRNREFASKAIAAITSCDTRMPRILEVNLGFLEFGAESFTLA